MGTEFVGAIDVGGTKISSALFTRAGEMIAKLKSLTDRTGGDCALDQIVERIGSLEQSAWTARGRLAAIGICVPGIVYAESGAVWAPNIPGWDDYPLRDKIRRTGGIPPLAIESDRSAYVAGEAWRGAAAGARDAVFLAVGTGVGAGILAGGRIIHGHEDIAGAVGWFCLNPKFRKEYESMGCFEAEASGAALARKARAVLKKGRPSILLELAGGDAGAITAETVAEAARRKDPVAVEVTADVAGYLAMGVANIVSVLNPEVVVLGGGLFQAADVFLEPVRAGFRRWAQPKAASRVRVEVSALGDDAGLFGCGRLAWDRIKEA